MANTITAKLNRGRFGFQYSFDSFNYDFQQSAFKVMIAAYCVVIVSLVVYNLKVIFDVTYLNTPYFKLALEIS